MTEASLLNWKSVQQSARALVFIPKSIRDISVHMKYNCASDSKARREIDTCNQSYSLETAYAQGIRHYLFVASDHMSALERSLRPMPNRLSLAPWTCVRVILDSCSRSAWLLEEDISSHCRLTRSLNWHLYDQKQLLKYLRSDLSHYPEQLQGNECEITGCRSPHCGSSEDSESI